MKRCLIAVLLGVLAAPAFAYQPDPDESQLREHRHYTNRDGEAVHSPAHSRDGRAPTGATAHCRDGTALLHKSSEIR